MNCWHAVIENRTVRKRGEKRKDVRARNLDLIRTRQESEMVIDARIVKGRSDEAWSPQWRWKSRPRSFSAGSYHMHLFVRKAYDIDNVTNFSQEVVKGTAMSLFCVVK